MCQDHTQLDNLTLLPSKPLRKKLWQLDGAVHCSIIGTCLSLSELHALCKKLKISVQVTLSEYELHRAFVAVVAQRCYAAQRLHKYLDEKYRIALRRFASAQSDAELAMLWRKAMQTGELASAYWALMTHAHASPALCNRVYGEVHMLSHLAGASVRVDMQELSNLKRREKSLSAELATHAAKTRAALGDKDEAIADLRRQLARAEMDAQQLGHLRLKLAAVANDANTAKLRKQLKASQSQRDNALSRAERAEASAEQWKQLAMQNGDLHLRLEAQLSQVQAERDSLETTLEKLLNPECHACDAQATCVTRSLCGRCILYVGGRSRQCANFRELVERHDGRFIHHDGGLHDSRLQLKSILAQADAVLCPLDCVSHDAALRVKQHCKQHMKQLVFLPTSSLAAFTRGLNELVA
ncbi:MAG: DUF2325 domain-containing protein [Gammaproteobacteria bacterium]|nr:DUF2325 domain-containing protein [Gammaproteobacteria bacterium]